MNQILEPLLTSLRKRIDGDPHLAGRDLLSLARPSVRLASQRVPYAAIGMGDSRIGGLPDVPPDFEWPRWMPTNTRDQFPHPGRPAPLGFIAQIDMSHVPPVDDALPVSGWLCFFYDRYCEPWGFDPADRGCCRVTYADCDRSSLSRAEPPSDADPDHVAHPCLVEAHAELTLPDDMPDLEYGTPEYESYRSLWDDLTADSGLTHHRLLGHPQLVQNPMERECQLASNGVYCGNSVFPEQEKVRALEAGAADWRLLLQIDTDEEGPGWMWGDVGRIYFWIRRQDLAARRFTDVILQCC
jgi:uncharacterized protein YwqG